MNDNNNEINNTNKKKDILEEIMEKIKKINKETEEINLNIQRKKDVVKVLKKNLVKLDNVKIQLFNKLNNLYNYFGNKMRDINDRATKVGREMNNAVKYRYNKKMKIGDEIKIELEGLQKYMGKKFDDVSKIENLKSEIRKVNLEIQKFEQEILVNETKIINLDVELKKLKEEEKKLEREQKLIIVKQEKIIRDHKLKEIENLKDIEKSGEMIGGNKRRKNKQKKVRKHKGINQKTGKLKKGYKYTGRKLKSGIPEIKRINKK